MILPGLKPESCSFSVIDADMRVAGSAARTLVARSAATGDDGTLSEICSIATMPPGGFGGGTTWKSPAFTRVRMALDRRGELPMPRRGRVTLRKAPESIRSGTRLARVAARMVVAVALTRECRGAVSSTAVSGCAVVKCWRKICCEAARANWARRSNWLALSTPSTCCHADAIRAVHSVCTTSVPKPAGTRLRGSRFKSLTQPAANRLTLSTAGVPPSIDRRRDHRIVRDRMRGIVVRGGGLIDKCLHLGLERRLIRVLPVDGCRRDALQGTPEVQRWTGRGDAVHRLRDVHQPLPDPGP